jgi:nicotinamidase-related amidase
MGAPRSPCQPDLSEDATAAFDREGMHAAHEVNGPRFAPAILTTQELLALLPH